MNIFLALNEIYTNAENSKSATGKIYLSPIFWCRESYYPIFHIFLFWRKIIWIKPKQLQFENNFKRILNFDPFKLPINLSYNLKKSFIFSHENHWVAWSFWIKNISKWNSNLFKTLFIHWNGRNHVIFSREFCDEKNLNPWIP